MKHSWQRVKSSFVATLLVISSGLAYAETSTATADDAFAEAVVVGKTIQNMPKAEGTPPSETESSSSTRPVATGDEEAPTLPTLNTPVIDPLNLLSDTDRVNLSEKIYQLYDAGKAQVGIVIVPTTGQYDIFSYSLQIAEQWQLGSAKYDNGLLIVVAINDRRIQILTGYGLEGVLPDIVVNRIINQHITPSFKQAQYGHGLLSGLNEIERILNLDPEIARQAADQIKAQQELVQQKAEASQANFSRAFIILMIAVFASAIFGRKLAGVGAGVAGVASGLIAGTGLLVSVVTGLILFILISSSVAQFLTHAILSSRGGGFGGGGRGGFGGGGGGFGGGGASGSW